MLRMTILHSTFLLTALAALSMSTVAHCQSPDWGWSDGFESYQAGKFTPDSSNPWLYGNGNPDYFIDTAAKAGGDQSMRLYGKRYRCYGALLQRYINPNSKNLPSDFYIEFDFRSGNIATGGCHPGRASGSLRTSTGWWSNSAYYLYYCDASGNLFVAEERKTPIAKLQLLSWNHLRIRVTHLPDNSVRLRYYLNNKYILDKLMPGRANTNDAHILSLEVQEGYAWYDNVRVYPAIESGLMLVPKQIKRTSAKGDVLAIMQISLEAAKNLNLNNPWTLYPGAIPANRTWLTTANGKAILFGFFSRDAIFNANASNGQIKVICAIQDSVGRWLLGTDSLTLF